MGVLRRKKKMSDEREKIYQSGRVICGHCKKPMKIKHVVAEKVYHYNGCFHFLCPICRKIFSFEKVYSCNTTLIFYEDKDGKVYNIYDEKKVIPIGEHNIERKN